MEWGAGAGCGDGYGYRYGYGDGDGEGAFGDWEGRRWYSAKVELAIGMGMERMVVEDGERR